MVDGAGGFTVNVTGMVTGLLVAPLAAMIMLALYVPAIPPVMLTDTVTLLISPVDVPLVGLKVSHLALVITVQLSVPEPELSIIKVLLCGLAPP